MSAGTGPSGSDTSADTSTSIDPTTTDPTPIDPPPSIDAFHVSPTSFSEPGPLTVALAHSDDVVEIEIYRGDALLRALPPDSPIATEVVIPILNHPDLAGTADVIAVVRDELGQEDARSEPVTAATARGCGCTPAPGRRRWSSRRASSGSRRGSSGPRSCRAAAWSWSGTW